MVSNNLFKGKYLHPKFLFGKNINALNGSERHTESHYGYLHREGILLDTAYLNKVEI